MKLGNNLDLSQNSILNQVTHPLSAAPSGPKEGQTYYSLTTHSEYHYNGTTWRPHDAALLTDGSVQNSALATNPLARVNHTGTQPSATISDLSTVVRGYTLDTFAAPVAFVTFNNQRLTGLATATNPTDAVGLQQMQQAIAGVSSGQKAILNPVRVVATGSITLSGTQTMDGVALAAGDSVLATAQTTGSQDLIYTVAAGAWTQRSDMVSGGLIEGTEVLVAEGTLYGGTIWRVTTTGTITIGTTSVAWVQTTKINTYSADTVTIQLTGMQFSAILGYGITTSSGIAIDRTKVPSKYAVTITGDGTTTSFTATHNLNTTDVQMILRDSTGTQVLTDNVAATVNTVTVSFGQAPAAGTTYRVIVMG